MLNSNNIFATAGLLTLASAFSPLGAQTYGALRTPDTSSPVTQGQPYTVTWDTTGHPTEGVTVSLVLCRGPSTNCVVASTAIQEKIPAAQASYVWNVPCSQPAVAPSETDGNGMLIIVDGTGEFQYSTQFAVLANPACAGVSTTTTSSTTSLTSSTTSSSSPSTTSSKSTLTTTVTPYGNGTHTGTGWNDWTSTTLTSATTVVTPTPATTTTQNRASATTSPAQVTPFRGAASKVGGSLSLIAVAVGAFFAL